MIIENPLVKSTMNLTTTQIATTLWPYMSPDQQLYPSPYIKLSTHQVQQISC